MVPGIYRVYVSDRVDIVRGVERMSEYHVEVMISWVGIGVYG